MSGWPPCIGEHRRIEDPEGWTVRGRVGFLRGDPCDRLVIGLFHDPDGDPWPRSTIVSWYPEGCVFPRAYAEPPARQREAA